VNEVRVRVERMWAPTYVAMKSVEDGFLFGMRRVEVGFSVCAL